MRAQVLFGGLQFFSLPDQISPSPSTVPFWKEKYETDARRYWDIFYKRHEDKGRRDGEKMVVLEVQTIEIKAKGHDFKIKMLTKEFQHTCKLTGLMLWESGQFMCSLLAENPSIVAGKRELELGCGSDGICSMVAASFAKFVIATDGDVESLDLLRQNISSNLEFDLLNKVTIRKLFWGNKDDVMAVRDLSGNDAGFDCIIGTDVTYNPDAVFPLFKTARELISDEADEDSGAALILCYIQRRVDEDSMLSNAMARDFRLVDKWNS